jgi:1-deoxy-D-xylulose-5-phosphate synthase
MGLLETIQSPSDLRSLTPAQLTELAAEIRGFLIAAVARTGGHLGPNLGVVELTLALHRVFDSPRDTLVFDTGHQAYVHKLVTGRQDFTALKSAGGLSGYPSRAESRHDVVENSHASTSLSWADGIAKARRLAGERDRHTVAVIGDGALTGGMAWEALNTIAADKDLPLVIVVNDNERSYGETKGGLAEHLATLRTTRGYERFLTWGKQTLNRTPVVGGAVYDTLHGVKKGLKDIVAPQGMFEDLGLKYIGPVDGHDVEAMERALRRARAYGSPVIVHVITQKGRGYEPALRDEADRFHAVGVIDAETGQPLVPVGADWTSVFADEVLAIAERRPDVVGLTAAMLIPVGLDRFAARFPQRVFDVGIAEQHATTSAAGMAYAGLHPVVAVYATFLNRAFDQVLMDVALHRAGVTFVLDRAGLTGSDGPSHNGMWDLSILQVVPGLRLAAPRDATTLREELREAVEVRDAPTVVRYPKGVVPADLPAIARVGDDAAVDVLSGDGGDVLLVSVGAMAHACVEAAARLADHGISSQVVDPRWVIPVPEAIATLARGRRLVAVVEDSVRVGGVGTAVAQLLRDRGVETPVLELGIPREFLDHAPRGALLAQVGLTGQALARRIVEAVAQREPEIEDAPRAAERGPA